MCNFYAHFYVYTHGCINIITSTKLNWYITSLKNALISSEIQKYNKLAKANEYTVVNIIKCKTKQNSTWEILKST